MRSIHDNCRALLRTHHQRAGLELMDLMANYQETAYERLCRYGGCLVGELVGWLGWLVGWYVGWWGLG